MTLHAASREAQSAAEARLDEVLADAGADPSVVGEELLSVVGLLAGQAGLRHAISDGSSDPEARKSLVHRLLDDKVSGPTTQILEAVVANRWSRPRELVDGLEAVGRKALFTAAERAGNLSTVEDQLFRIERILETEPELEQALSDRTTSAETKRKLIRHLIADKVDPVTRVLVEQVVVRPRGRSVAFGVSRLVELAAATNEYSVAYVTSAIELTEEQRDRLSTRLEQIYQRPVTLHVAVDPSVRAGLVVRVGNEVIDGSVAGRFDALRRQLAG